MTNEELLNTARGATISKAWLGVGSFLVIDVTNRAAGFTASLWVYMCDWAILRGKDEVCSSQTAVSGLEIPEIIGQVVRSFDWLDAEEFHVTLSGDARVELWANPSAYGPLSEAVKIYKEGTYLGSILL